VSQKLRFTLAALALLGLASTGFFYFRDNLSTHYPLKTIQAEILLGGELPLWTRATGGGQPLGGNPNSLLFYPDTLLFLVLPSIIAFNLHFLIHFVIALFAMRALLENCGSTREVATWCAALYVASGAAISTAAFYNLVVAIAFVPMAASALISLLRETRLRDMLKLGLACGLLGLAAEPINLASTTFLLLILAWGRRMLRITPQLLGAVALALVIASPLLFAYSDIAWDVERSGFRYSTETVLNASLSPLRLTEMFVGPFQGTITNLSGSGFGPSKGARFPQFLPSVFVGALAIPALFAGWKSISARWLLALGLLALCALGRFNPIVTFFVDSIPELRIARFPEKLVIPMTICLVVLIARLVGTAERLSRRAAMGAIASFLVISVVTIAYSELDSVDRVRCAVGAVIGIGVLFLAMRSLHRALAAAVILAVCIAFVTLPVDSRSHYEKPALARSVIPHGAKIVHRIPSTSRVLPSPSARDQYRTALLMGDPITGSLSGLQYVLDGSPDGMHSFLSRLARERSTQVDERTRLKYITLAGAEYIVATALPPAEFVRAEGEISYGPNRAMIGRIIGALPPLHAPLRIITAPSVQHAASAIESSGFVPGRDAVAARAKPAGAIRTSDYRESANGFIAKIAAGSPATVITRESWFRAWRVTIDGAEVETFPANIDRLGFVVPAGAHEVKGEFGRRTCYVVGSAFLSLAAILLSVILAFSASSRAMAAPAR